MTSPPVLEMLAVSRSYIAGDDTVLALNDVALTLSAGELVLLQGPSGSGKSTLMRIAAGLEPPDSGVVFVGGHAIGGFSAARLAVLRRRSVGVIFQNLNLLPSLTAGENVTLPLELDGMSTKVAKGVARAALSEVGLAGFDRRRPDTLSGGQQQRVAIARGLVGERRLLLADEPTGALDQSTGRSIMDLLRKLCDGGAAALVVTHDTTLKRWADRVLRIEDGRLA